MLQLTPHQTILLATKPVDFRKGIDGLAGLCRTQLNQDPFSGRLFVFTNRQKIALKILLYDGQGFWLCFKRFSKGKLNWWPTASDGTLSPLAASELQILLYQGIPQAAQIPQDWRPLRPLEPFPHQVSAATSKEASSLDF